MVPTAAPWPWWWRTASRWCLAHHWPWQSNLCSWTSCEDSAQGGGLGPEWIPLAWYEYSKRHGGLSAVRNGETHWTYFPDSFSFFLNFIMTGTFLWTGLPLITIGFPGFPMKNGGIPGHSWPHLQRLGRRWTRHLSPPRSQRFGLPGVVGEPPISPFNAMKSGRKRGKNSLGSRKHHGFTSF